MEGHTLSINLELQAVGLDLIALESLILNPHIFVHWNNCMAVEYVSRWGDLQDLAPGGGIPSG